jgi:hypothetical protein
MGSVAAIASNLRGKETQVNSYGTEPHLIARFHLGVLHPRLHLNPVVALRGRSIQFDESSEESDGDHAPVAKGRRSCLFS